MKKEIYYRFSKMDLTQFATFEDNYNEDASEIEISCTFTFAYNFEQNIVCCSNVASFIKNGMPLLKANLDVYFTISPSSVSELSEDNAIVLSPELQAQFASLAYGTMRGVIFTKTMGTALNNIILPPNDVMSIIKQPVRFTLEK